MAATPKELYEVAMSLGPDERAELVALLLETLEIEGEDGVESAWLVEFQRRIEAIDSGQTETLPWAEVRTRIFEPRAR